jgi:hypothetical protein
LTHRLLSREKKGYFSFHLFNNLPIGFFVGIKKESPKRRLRAFRRAPQTIGSSNRQGIFIMASGCLQGRRPFYFAFGRGLLPLVRFEVLRVSAMLEGAGLLL